MIYIILDTCVFAELIKEIEYDDILNQLLYWDYMGAIQIIVPTIILDEWERNKSEFENYRKNILKNKIANTKEILELLEIENNQIKEIVSKFKLNENVIVEMNRLDNFINKGVSIPISDEVKLKATEFALEKRAPFGSKNSMGDALIAFSTIEYLEKQSGYEAYFISHNTKDFSQDKSHKNILNSDLQIEFDAVNLQYFSHIRVASQKLITKYNLPTKDLIPKITDFIAENHFDEFVNRKIQELQFNEKDFISRQTQNSAYIDIENSSFLEKRIQFREGYANTEYYAIKKSIEEAGRVFRDFPSFDSIRTLIPIKSESKIFELFITKKNYESYFNIDLENLRSDINNWRSFLKKLSINYKTLKDDFKNKYIVVKNEA